METLLIVIFALLGTAVGSFLNVCIDRLPAGKSIIYPPSHCDTCQHRLAPIDLIPIFSYLWLRRRCRYCQVRIPLRPFWVEIGSGCLFAFACWHYGLGAELAVAVFYGSVFLVLGVIDLEHGLLLNKIVFPTIVAAFIIDAFLPPPGIINFSLPLPWPGIVSGVMGGAMGFTLFLVIYWISILIYKKEGIGQGDIKLAILIGLVTGSGLVIVAITIGAILGALIGVSLIALKRKERKEAIPFGPFLSLAAIATLFWGNYILSWYLGMF